MSAITHPLGPFVGSCVLRVDSPIVDARGSLRRILSGQIGSVVLIDSKAGTMRASHRHHNDWHFCYVLSGSIAYIYRSGSGLRYQLVDQGEMVFTPPEEDHWMYFVAETVFLTLADRERTMADYEADLVRVPALTTDELRVALASRVDDDGVRQNTEVSPPMLRLVGPST